MQRRKDLFRAFVLTGVLLTLWTAHLRAQPAPMIRANVHVDAANAGAEDGSALRPYRTVQQAIDAAKENTVIAVAGGTYSENIRVQGKVVHLYGGYIGGTKASYAKGTAGNFTVRHPATKPTHFDPSHLKGNGKDSVVTMTESGASIVDGFLVTGGGRSALAAPLFLGGGFYINGGSPTISNNVIEKNQTCPPVKQEEEKLGGGIYANGETISILDNVIRNNVSGRGAGISAEGKKVVIRGNLIQNNIGGGDHGGGIRLFSPNAEISYNRIVGNEVGRALGYGWGGGIVVVNKPGSYKFSHNIFTGNFAPSVGSAIFVDDGAVASLDHDLIYANACNPAGDGAVPPIYVDGLAEKFGSALTMNHVTIAGHTCKPPVPGFAISVTDKSKVTVKNSILWNNGGGDINVDATSKATVTYTLSQKVQPGTGNLSKDPLFADAAKHDYRLSSQSPALKAAEPAPNGARANLGADVNSAQAGKEGKAVDPATKGAEDNSGPSITVTPDKLSKTYLLRGTAGELPSEVGNDSTKMTKLTSSELGGTVVQIELIDSFGQKNAAIGDWTTFSTLRLDIISKGAKDVEVGFNLFHSGTKNFGTRVVAPFVLKPGKNEIRIAIQDLKNSNGSPAKLSEVRRWFVSSETQVTLVIGDIFLEGKAGSAGASSVIKTDPARLERIRSAKMPSFTKPVPYNTP
jgi:Protein of unknown function (DUF1565)